MRLVRLITVAAMFSIPALTPCASQTPPPAQFEPWTFDDAAERQVEALVGEVPTRLGVPILGFLASKENAARVNRAHNEHSTTPPIPVPTIAPHVTSPPPPVP